jgi:hypothetical protein
MESDHEAMPEPIPEPGGQLVPPPRNPPTALALSTPPPPPPLREEIWRSDRSDLVRRFRAAVNVVLDGVDDVADTIAEAIGMR